MRWLVCLFVLAGCKYDGNLEAILKEPVVTIDAPSATDILRQGEGPLLFLGTATDEADEPTELAVTWTFDDGTPLPVTATAEGGVEWSLDVTDFALGTHRTKLTAIDTDGLGAEVQITWELLGVLTPPTAEITAPDDASLFAPGTEVTFRGVGSDAVTAPDDLQFAWKSSVDGDLTGALSADGESVLFTSALSEGAHTITLTVTDEDGETAEDSIAITIDAPIVEPEPGDLVFSEMMINPDAVADELGEWVELYNTSGFTLDIGGYSFHDLDFDLYELEGPLLVAPHDYIVLCADMDPRVNGGVPCDGPFKRESQDALALGNNSDEVILSRPDGEVIDELYYTSEWFESGIAIGLSPEYLDSGNDDISKWCNQTTVISTDGEPGTPGQANDTCDN